MTPTFPLPLRFAAARDVFMMAHCEVTAQPDGQLVSITTSDTPAELDPKLPRFRKLNLRPNVDPTRASPRHLLIKYDGFYVRAPLDKPRELLCPAARASWPTYDPDVIQTHFGDTWLFSHLEEASKQTGVPAQPQP